MISDHLRLFSAKVPFCHMKSQINAGSQSSSRRYLFSFDKTYAADPCDIRKFLFELVNGSVMSCGGLAVQ